MMKNKNVTKCLINLICVCLLFISPMARTQVLSPLNFPTAVRDKNTDYRTYFSSLSTQSFEDTPQLTSNDLLVMQSWDDLQSLFEDARDRRNLRWLQMPKFPRRTTFLYPQDGCFLRAAQMNRSLIAKKWLPLHKIFVFGNLATKSKFDQDGMIYWYFHVALAVTFQNEVYVIDPSLDFHSPIHLTKWLGLMNVTTETAEVRICDPQSYTPFDRCQGGQGSLEERQRDDHAQYYLAAEWNNLQRLGYQPSELLDDSPPWSIKNLIDVSWIK